MTKRTRVRLLLVGEFEVNGPNPMEAARAQLDAFRETVQPATEYGLTLYQATAEDLAGFGTSPRNARGIDPAQAAFWDSLGSRPLERAEVEPYGIEYLTDPPRLRDIRRLYPCPTVIDAGHGVFGAIVGLLYVDDETGRAVAYAPPHTVLRTALDDRGETIRILRDGLVMIDAIATRQWAGAGATLGRVHEAAIETLRRAGLRGLDGSPKAAPH
jgi:hypothetical protein